MRYFSYEAPAENGDHETRTLSEEEIRKQYYPVWYEGMCKKYSKEYVDSTYSFDDCLEDWIVMHWAWESE